MASQDTSDLVHTLDSVVRGHHVYKRPTVGERLQLRPEEDKCSESSGRSKRHGVIVGHLPRKTAGVHGCVTRVIDRACGGKFSARLILRFDFLRAGNKLAIRNY